ncbi:FKBP-type peptidyl-prolyl cis-trans isomerase [Larkinella rosea]|uniref:Peptidyl-prolyl cis-trans isomerase n=1 Tax=Larkinella rosea TaxID=2025312 RepID=A0A3P1BT68_9BACT|nr:FKBP-type peptidyl-prolyl cis-trans isomerase [Larkinella rosea]RRB04310.1 hypothetical protein EHT25_12420 [Larkinella rosea]
MKFHPFYLYIFLYLAVSACKNNFNDPSAGAAEKNDQQIKDYLSANQLLNKVTPTSTGLYYAFSDTTSTRNKRAQLNEEIEFNFTLSYIDGNKTILVDSANQTKSVYSPFVRGVVVLGLEEGLLLMKEGQRALFFMPSNLAFGQGSSKIPEYVPVVFNVKLHHSRTETEQIMDYAAIKKLGRPTLKAFVEGSKDSVWVYRLTQGTGPKVTSGKTVTVAYSAQTLRGKTPFETQTAREISVGVRQATVVAGLLNGLSQLNVGDKALLVFASSLGYGTQGIVDKTTYTVTPYSPLAYDVTVTSVK